MAHGEASLAELEKATDLAAIDLFEAEEKRRKLRDELTFLDVHIQHKNQVFMESKMAHLRAKHGIQPIPITAYIPPKE